MIQYSQYRLVCIALIGAAVSLSSCSSLPSYERTQMEMPKNYRHSANQGVTDSLSGEHIGMIPYSEFFTDPTLVELIKTGIAQNNDLQVAVRQIEIASLAYGQTKWNNVPTANLTLGAASVNRPSDNSLNGLTIGQFLGQKYLEDYSTSLSLSWEADIWGKIRARKQGAYAGFLQTQEATKAVQTRLVAEIANGYYNLLMLDLQLEITNKNLELVETTLTMIKVQQGLGITTSLAVQQQENTRDQMLVTVPVLKQAITTQENVLSILTGKMPGEIARTVTLTQMDAPNYSTAGIPAQMLENRPDVKSQELAVLQAVADSNVAKRSMYPSLNITAQGGLNTFQFENWFNLPGSLFGTAVGSLAQPLLNGKRLKTQYKQSKVMVEQAELRFKQSVLNAVGEVSNNLTAIESLAEQETITMALSQRAEESVNTATIMFQNDLGTYLDVIVAQNNKLQAELSLASIKKQKLSAYVNLYRSLGGGWQQ